MRPQVRASTGGKGREDKNKYYFLASWKRVTLSKDIRIPQKNSHLVYHFVPPPTTKLTRKRRAAAEGSFKKQGPKDYCHDRK